MIARMAAIGCMSTMLWGASPWLPEPGKLAVNMFYTFDTFQDYHPGAKTGRLPQPYKQYTGYTFFEYGLRNNISVDVETGYTATSYLGNGLQGIVDTTVGARWQVLSGESYVVTLRGAAIINGSYELTRTANFSPGDKASGFLTSVLVGKNLPRNFFSFLETGYRVRTNPVPQDFFGNAGIGKSFRRFTVSTGYQTSRSMNGVDIGTPGFRPLLFPATKKIFGAMDFNGTYRFKSGVNVGFNYSKILHGRNVGVKDVFAVSLGFNLPGKLPHFK